MGIDVLDLRELIIRPTLEQLNQWSPVAEDLLLGTAAVESQLGYRLNSLTQNGLGLFNISAECHLQVWDCFLVADPEQASRVRGLASQQQFLKSPHAELVTNLSYATAIAWMLYKSSNLLLPSDSNLYSLAECWFTYYANRNCQSSSPNLEKNEAIESFADRYRELILTQQKKIAA